MKRKKYTFRQMMQTVTGRITILIATMVVPVNIITLVFLGANYVNTRSRIEAEIESSLVETASEIRSDLMNAKKRMLYETLDATTIVELAEKEIPDANRLYELQQDILKRLEGMQLTQGRIHTVFYYFEDKDMFLVSGNAGITSEIRNYYIKDTIQNMQGNSSWKTDWLSGTQICTLVQKQGNIYYGMILRLNLLSNNIRNNEAADRELFLGNEGGSVLSSDGMKFLEDENLTFDELVYSSHYYVAKAEVKGTGLYLYDAVSMKEIEGMTGYTSRILLFVLGIFTIVVIPLLIFFIRRFVINPLDDLNMAMDRIEGGDTEYRIKAKATGLEFAHINNSFNAMMDQLENLKIEMYERDIEEKNVRLEYLSQQVQPHFILNAMNILYSYEPEEYELSQKMIMCISKYFRHIVYANERFVTLKSEMDHISNYFEIQKARFPDLFYSIVEYDENISEALIPPLVIQTFAENSIKHSLKIGNRITIFLIAEIYDNGQDMDLMRIRLADTGEGISDQLLEEIDTFKKTGVRQKNLGVGIQNTIERFKVLYKDGAQINFSRDEHYPGTNIEIILPIHYRGENTEVENF